MHTLNIGDLAVVKNYNNNRLDGTIIRITKLNIDGYFGEIVTPSKLCGSVRNTLVYFHSKYLVPIQPKFYALVETEAERGLELHGPISSLHEGYAVILAEIDEIWDEIKKKKPDKQNLLKECVQAAAVLKKLYGFIENNVTE